MIELLCVAMLLTLRPTFEMARKAVQDHDENTGVLPQVRVSQKAPGRGSQRAVPPDNVADHPPAKRQRTAAQSTGKQAKPKGSSSSKG